MDIQGFFTPQGQTLCAKLAAGAALTVTRVVAGSGQTPSDAQALSQPRQTLALSPAQRRGDTAAIPATLLASAAEAAYSLTELGVYAKDPDAGEILYKVYRLPQSAAIQPASRLVLRFYLEETVSQDAAVTVNGEYAGLITEAQFSPVREAVLASAVPTRQLSISGGDLPDYLNSLPRLLTEELVILVSGTVTQPLSLTGLHGSGGLFLRAAEGGCTVKNTVSVQNCSVRVVLQNLRFTDQGAAAGTYYRSVVLGVNAGQLAVEECTFTGDLSGRAVLVTNASRGWVSRCTVTGFESGLCAWGYSLLGAEDVSASGNTHGAHLYNGGVLLLTGKTPELLGGAANINSDGLLVKGGKIL